MMAKVWDLDRSERYHDNREALARFMMLRELARRPRNANAMETLGLARLRFPDIERIGKEMLPEAVAAKGYSIEDWRSEEHTSELQSLMRISYAVFCLKKNNNNNTTT